jgi:general secretion pathway protein G
MLERIRKAQDQEHGFTLIELLIVIIILGILAAIVVFAVGGITDRGQTSACSTDKKTVETAEEAYFAQNSHYSDEAGLVPTYLHEDSQYYKVTTTGTSPNFTAYSVVKDGAITGNPCS